MNSELFIDKRNLAIWNEVQEEYQTSVQLYNGREYRHQLFEQKAVIFIPENNPSTELFTHELLHIYLRRKRIFITEYLLQRLKDEPLLYWSLTDNLFEQVGHYLEHIHMLPIYLNCGFDRTNFIEDYETPVFSQFNLQLLYSGMKKNPPSIAILDLYINKFFAMQASCNNSIIYISYLEDLREMDPILFSILQSFWQSWSSYNINTYHPVDNSYKDFTKAFMHELGVWSVRSIYARKKIA